MAKNRKATMADVAKHAGVSLGTVSKVVNNIHVGESYKKKVLKAIDELDYQVNTYARTLKSNKSNLVALIIPNTITPFFSALAQYVNDALQRQGYTMLLAFTEYNLQLEKEILQMAYQRKVAGIIVLSYNPDLIIPDDIPFVSIDRAFPGKVPCVSSDNYTGGYMAAQKLHELGADKLAFFRVGSNLSNEPNKRKDGFFSYCTSHKVDFTAKILDDSEDRNEFAKFIDENIIDGKLRFNGIFCVTDLLAYNIIKLLKERNIRIPEDVQVIGFDGTRMFGTEEYYCSTIVQPVEQIAKTCVDIVLYTESKYPNAVISLPVKYAPSGTTKD